ncbi:discoidin domain-containing protein [Sphingobacterium cavernae]|uniref:discoidin domain-containing protein n=1 Tax=Sphingobacterium cavernae TaxID=2592657 RepID=UPI00122FC125|nr:discoidin domain-containing protein [Sphingobacterium cavernae]
MKKINKSLFVLGLGIATLFACKEDKPTYEQLNDTREQAWLSVQKAANGQQDLVLFPQVQERKDVFRVNYGGVGYPSEDISITFAQDQKALDSVNRIRQIGGLEPYIPFPAGSYTLDKSSVNIQAGTTGSDFITLTYKPENFDLTKEYMLALTATNNKDYKFRAGSSTILYYAAVVEKPQSKTKWTAKVSSIHTGESIGTPGAIVDGNINTFWHTPYSAGSPNYPHWAEIDFGEEIYATKIGITKRQANSTGFKTFDILGSKDGTTWITLASNQVMEQFNDGMQVFDITPQYLKKIKLDLKNSFGGQNYTHLAEVDVIGY